MANQAKIELAAGAAGQVKLLLRGGPDSASMRVRSVWASGGHAAVEHCNREATDRTERFAFRGRQQDNPASFFAWKEFEVEAGAGPSLQIQPLRWLSTRRVQLPPTCQRRCVCESDE